MQRMMTHKSQTTLLMVSLIISLISIMQGLLLEVTIIGFLAGDVKMRGKRESRQDTMPKLGDGERKLLEKLNLPGYKLRFRSHFLSLHRIHRRHRSAFKLSKESKPVIDNYYHCPTQLMLDQAGNWDFNIFHLDILTGGRSLLHLGVHLFRKYGFLQQFNLDPIKLLRFISLVEDNYHDQNPYHNVIHASDVTQAMHCYLQEEKIRQSLTPLENMMTLLSSMTHDLDHPGVNQAFLISSGNHLAALYNNTSVLEMHHWRCAVALLQETELLSHLPQAQWTSGIWQLKSLILATDITRQQEFLIKFRRMQDLSENDFETNPKTRNFILQIALKCADICNPCRNWYLSKKWSDQVCEEFFRQGDTERGMGLPVTPICDRQINTVAKVQTGFMEIVVKPLFVEWQRFMPTVLSQKMLDNIGVNQRNWQVILERESVVPESDSSSSSYGDRSQSPGGKFSYHQDTTVDVDKASQFKKPIDMDADIEEEGGDTVDNSFLSSFRFHNKPFLSDGAVSESCVDLKATYSFDRRRHSMPVVIRTDLDFYIGLSNCNLVDSNNRRQSMPTEKELLSSGLEQTTLSDLANANACSNKQLLFEGQMWQRPRINTLSSNYLSFLPLASQTHILQQAGWSKSLPYCMADSQPHRQSVSCVELRTHSTQLPACGMESLNAALNCDASDKSLKPPEVFGLASSWPKLTHNSSCDSKILKKWSPGCISSPLEHGVDYDSSSLEFGNNTGAHDCQSSSKRMEVLSLSRPH